MGNRSVKQPDVWQVHKDAGKKWHRPDWMAEVPDDRPLSRLSIPGTHQTMSYHTQVPTTDDIACQAWSLRKQMVLGVRYLDIGCRHFGNSLPLHRDSYFLDGHFDDVLLSVADYLKVHKGEVFIVNVYKQHKDKANCESFDKTVARNIDKLESVPIWKGELDTMLTLGEVRGQIIVIMQDEESMLPYWNWSHLNVHSDFAPPSDEDKITQLISHIDAASESESNKIFLTNATYALLLIPVLKLFAKPKKVPRSAREVSLILNPAVLEHIAKVTGNLGIIVTDFPGPRLISDIIDHNFDSAHNDGDNVK